MQRVLESRAFIAALLAMATGAFLFYTQPFPDQQIFLRVIAVRPASFLELQIPLLRALVHHALPGLLDRAFGTLHLHSESAPRHLAGTAPPLSRSQYEMTYFWSSARSTTRASRSREGSLLAHDSRARFVHGNRHLGRYR